MGNLNCRSGDLAVTFGAPMDNGLIVNVIERAGFHSAIGELWMVESIGSDFHVEPGRLSKKACWPDRLLRPIRDQPGDDEALAWAGKPNQHEVAPC